MPIDWPKAEAKPEKKQSVPGNLLLDLRGKINKFENHLSDTKTELERTQSSLVMDGKSLENATNILNSTKSHLNSTKLELSNTKSNLEQTLTKFAEKSKINAQLTSEIEEFKANIERANSKISELENKKIELGVFISNLSSELENSNFQIKLLKKSASEDLEQTDNFKFEIQELNNMLTLIRDENANLNIQLMELDSLLIKKDLIIQELTEKIENESQLISAQTAHLEEVESELGELKPLTEEKLGITYETRITCPMCRAVGKNIREVEDKTTILYWSGGVPVYAKKYVCKKCGYEWNKM